MPCVLLALTAAAAAALTVRCEGESGGDTGGDPTRGVLMLIGCVVVGRGDAMVGGLM